MADEEKSESTGGSIKNILIGLVSTITLGVGGWFTTKLTGGDEKEAPVQQAAPVININNTQQQQQSAAIYYGNSHRWNDYRRTGFINIHFSCPI